MSIQADPLVTGNSFQHSTSDLRGCTFSYGVFATAKLHIQERMTAHHRRFIVTVTGLFSFPAAISVTESALYIWGLGRHSALGDIKHL